MRIGQVQVRLDQIDRPSRIHYPTLLAMVTFESVRARHEQVSLRSDRFILSCGTILFARSEDIVAVGRLAIQLDSPRVKMFNSTRSMNKSSSSR